MISVNEALAKIEARLSTTDNTSVVDLRNSLDHILSEDIISPISMPPFRQSAMDGYAVKLSSDQNFRLIGEIQAGGSANPVLKPGDAVRIFTGAPVPDDADAVVMQEQVKGPGIVVEAEIRPGQNIREMGEEIKAGELALKAGSRITPAAVGYIASLGFADVSVFVKPRISIVVTGNELQPPGKELKRGEIYESNAYMLQAALKQDGFNRVTLHKVEDNLESTIDLISRVLDSSEIVLISGGISVGDYDYVGEALEENEVEEVFYKVKQKPGKPLYFGLTEENYVFALPGNPASALTCFYIYVLPAIRKYSGYSKSHLDRRLLVSETEYQKRGDRAQFLKAYAGNTKVHILDGQASSMIHSFSMANALVFLPENQNEVKKGDKLQVVMLP